MLVIFEFFIFYVILAICVIFVFFIYLLFFADFLINFIKKIYAVYFLGWSIFCAVAHQVIRDHLSLDILGRCGRDESCESSAAPGGLPQKLHLFNGPLINARIGVPGSRLSKLVAAGKSSTEIVGQFYLVALSRHPTDRETQHWKKQLDAITTADGKREFLEDFVWGLLICREFVTNH